MPITFASDSHETNRRLVSVTSDGTQQQASSSGESFSFTAKMKYPRSSIFGIEVYTRPEAIVRCIGWLYHDPNINVTGLHNDFWFYAPNTVAAQISDPTNKESEIHIVDNPSGGKSDRRLLWFRDVPSNINPFWGSLCSASMESLDMIRTNPQMYSIPIITPEWSPLQLPVAGVGFTPENPPQVTFATPDSVHIKTSAIIGEWIRCVVCLASIEDDFFGSTGPTEFWQFTTPNLTDIKNYKTYSVGDYHPPLLGGNFYQPKENKRHTVTIKVHGLEMASRYVAQCATSPVSVEDINQARDHLPDSDSDSNSDSLSSQNSETKAEDDSSEIVFSDPKYFSTRGNTEAIKSIYPSFVVANERTLIHLETSIKGDNYYKMIGFTWKDTPCESKTMISPTYLLWQRSQAYVLFDMKHHIGTLLVCFSGDGGGTWWLQDHKDAVIDVSAVSRHAVHGIIPTWSVIGVPTKFELKGSNMDLITGDGYSKKIALSLDACKSFVMEEYIEAATNHVSFTLQTYDQFDICFTTDQGKHFTLQITDHLHIRGYETERGPSNAQLRLMELENIQLNRPFYPDIIHYFGALHHIYTDITIHVETYEPSSIVQLFIDGIRDENFGNDPNSMFAQTTDQRVPINPKHIKQTTKIELKVTAPDDITTQSYIIEIKRLPDWNEHRIQSIKPNYVYSGAPVIWTVYPVIYGDNVRTRVGFVLNDPRADCRRPVRSLAIDANGQVQGSLEWNYLEPADFRLCYTVDGGQMWHKQLAQTALVRVDGTWVRTPWHIATGVVVILCIFGQYYCRRLHKAETQFGSNRSSLLSMRSSGSQRKSSIRQGLLDFENKPAE